MWLMARAWLCSQLSQLSVFHFMASPLPSGASSCPGRGTRGSHMSATESVVLPEASHLISLPSCFWGEARLCLQICSGPAVVPSQFIPSFPATHSSTPPVTFGSLKTGRKSTPRCPEGCCTRSFQRSKQSAWIFSLVLLSLLLQCAHSPLAPPSSQCSPSAQPSALLLHRRSGLATRPLPTSPTWTRASGGWRTCSASMPTCPMTASGS